MSVRENIATNVVSVISGITSPAVRKVSRQPFPLEELAQSQYPAILVQTQQETKEDQELGSGAKTRLCTLEFLIQCYIKGSDTNIDTARNTLATAIETARLPKGQRSPLPGGGAAGHERDGPGAGRSDSGVSLCHAAGARGPRGGVGAPGGA